MHPHHRTTIDRLTGRYRQDPTVLALLVVGSVARGDAFPVSDVDAWLIVTAGEYARRQASGELAFDATDLVAAPAEGAGGPVLDVASLRDAAARGPEPTRFALTDAIFAVSREPEIERLVPQIARYPEHEREDKLISFATQLPVHQSFLELAEYSRNPYLLAETAHELVFFGGRLLLAHNRILYPGRKRFLQTVERAPDKPAGIVDLAKHLLAYPSIRVGQAFCDELLGFHPWPRPQEGTMARFQRDRDFAWRRGAASLAES